MSNPSTHTQATNPISSSAMPTRIPRGFIPSSLTGTIRAIGFGMTKGLTPAMSGQMNWEWCRDWYQRDFYEQSPTGVECKEAPDNNLSQRRVLRGGCWLNTIRRVRTCNRLGEIPTLNSHKIGFRLVLRRRKVAL